MRVTVCFGSRAACKTAPGRQLLVFRLEGGGEIATEATDSSGPMVSQIHRRLQGSVRRAVCQMTNRCGLAVVGHRCCRRSR